MGKPKLHLIGGPTASGKTALALEMAAQGEAVIVNADAMQVYASVPLLSAQPTAEEKARCPHALFEVFAPTEKSSAGRWLDLAQAVLKKALDNGVMPIVVGGTGLYFRALLGGLSAMPDVPVAAHEDAVARYDAQGHAAFRAALVLCDPVAAERIKPNDRQRLIRAYEIVMATGRTLDDWQKEKPAIAFDVRATFEMEEHLLLPAREALYAACDARFLKMMEAGALAEVRALMEQKIDPSFPAMKILGVPELAAHLRGEFSLDEAVALAQQHTRNYAKRQVTWFKNQGFYQN